MSANVRHTPIMVTPFAPSLRERIAATVSSPGSSTQALEVDVTRYAGRLCAAGIPPVLLLLLIRSACRPSIQRALLGPHRAWAKFVLDRIVYCATHACYDAADAARV
jgi:hypothetical protein